MGRISIILIITLLCQLSYTASIQTSKNTNNIKTPKQKSSKSSKEIDLTYNALNNVQNMVNELLTIAKVDRVSDSVDKTMLKLKMVKESAKKIGKKIKGVSKGKSLKKRKEKLQQMALEQFYKAKKSYQAYESYLHKLNFNPKLQENIRELVSRATKKLISINSLGVDLYSRCAEFQQNNQGNHKPKNKEEINHNKKKEEKKAQKENAGTSEKLRVFVKRLGKLLERRNIKKLNKLLKIMNDLVNDSQKIEDEAKSDIRYERNETRIRDRDGSGHYLQRRNRNHRDHQRQDHISYDKEYISSPNRQDDRRRNRENRTTNESNKRDENDRRDRYSDREEGQKRGVYEDNDRDRDYYTREDSEDPRRSRNYDFYNQGIRDQIRHRRSSNDSSYGRDEEYKRDDHRRYQAELLSNQNLRLQGNKNSSSSQLGSPEVSSLETVQVKKRHARLRRNRRHGINLYNTHEAKREQYRQYPRLKKSKIINVSKLNKKNLIKNLTKKTVAKPRLINK